MAGSVLNIGTFWQVAWLWMPVSPRPVQPLDFVIGTPGAAGRR